MDEKALKRIIRSTTEDQLGPFTNKLQEEIKSIKKSAQFISNNFDEQRNPIDTLIWGIEDIKNENETLKEKHKNLETRINITEQKEKANNLVLIGVPEQNDIDEKQAVDKIFTTIKVPYKS
ncbi:hypothetical protein HHI36_018463 [Cryptolaemus montrouzieri]|uniref:Uncharacterized protein n=1 Tax=Cryptolaemus montrouzieri TaxID=559131 RepID=A0ABD2P015_9CUCU